DGRAGQAQEGRVPAAARRAARVSDGARGRHGAERPAAGQALSRGDWVDGSRPDQARRNGEGRHRRAHLPRAGRADQVHWSGRACGGPPALRSEGLRRGPRLAMTTPPVAGPVAGPRIASALRPPLCPDDLRWMGRALELAGRGAGLTSPNPVVGAVVVADGRAVGEGFHARAGGAHAEAAALGQAGGLARGATLYVT